MDQEPLGKEQLDVAFQSVQQFQSSTIFTISRSAKRSFFSKRVPSEQNKQNRLARPSDIDLFQRPISAVNKHRLHQLSDIREVSNSSKTPTIRKKSSSLPLVDGAKALPCTPEPKKYPSSDGSSSQYMTPAVRNPDRKPNAGGLGSRAASALSLPLRDVPERRSSISIFAQSLHGSRRKASFQELPKWQVPPAPGQSQTIPPRGRSNSPVRQAVNKSSQLSEAMRSSPSRTFIRTTPPLDILEKGSMRSDRVELSVHLPSPLFVGGGTIEGHLKLEVHDESHSRKSKPKPVSISRLSVDVIGVEEVNDGRRWVFLSLGSELLDKAHPPPPAILEGQRTYYESELAWNLKPASAIIPFCINLPLNLGPPPYLSKQASIRYILSPTAHFKIGEKRQLVRQTWNIQMLPVHDPQKALASLPSPLLATDSLTSSQGAEAHTVKLTAGLHRQTWVNGGKIFIDVHVVNGTPKTIKKLEIQLEKTTLWYTHAAAGTIEKNANHLRLPKRSDTEIISTTVIRKSKDWKGISPRTSEVRTCALEVPRGHVTISTGRYFEVRYFVNLVTTISLFKTCAVQLPVSLIHINSLDILPNSLAQVAASIEAKRARTVPFHHEKGVHQPYFQGQAFSAPRRQSLERLGPGTGMASNDISLLTQDLDQSPRRYGSVRGHQSSRQSTSARLENVLPPGTGNTSATHHHHKHHPSCYHYHLLCNQEGERPGTAVSVVSQRGLRLPRLQVSTSGLGFSESEFEVPADSPPRKVMLSEQERKMINQQKELKLQRRWSQKIRKRSIDDARPGRAAEQPPSWKNVTADPNIGPRQPGFVNMNEAILRPRPQSRLPLRADTIKDKEPVRPRSRTNPEGGMFTDGAKKHQRAKRSMDSYRRGPVELDGTLTPMTMREQRSIGGRASLERSL